MHIKYAYLPGERDDELLVRAVKPGKQPKGHGLLPQVQEFVEQLPRDDRYTYTLDNAMGYSEFYGANSNTDWYGYNSFLEFNGLLNAPLNYGRDPNLDKAMARVWPYGYPTFLNAAVFAHHDNKDAKELGFGDVLFATANPRMKRIELVKRVFNEVAVTRGHTSILNRLNAGERVDVSMGTKIPFDLCVAPESLVRTPTGHRAAGEIGIGDEVLTHRGRYRKVTRLFTRPSENDVIDLRVYGAPKLRLSAAHPMYVVRGEHLRACRGSAGGQRRRCTPAAGGVCRHCSAPITVTPEWVASQDIQPGDYVVTPREKVLNGAPGLEFSRLLGYYLGDGYRIRQRTGAKKDGDYRVMGVGFSVGGEESEHFLRLLETIRACNPKNGPTVYGAGSGRSAVIVNVYDQELIGRITALGGEDCRSKRLDEAVFLWDEAHLYELLAGWIDTDGHFDKKRQAIRVCSVNRGLVLDFQRVCRMLGLPAQITRSHGASGLEAWFLLISGTSVAGSPLSEVSTKAAPCAPMRSRPSSTTVVLPDMVLSRVRSVSREDVATTFVNFSVDEDESYVVEGLASHNCSICTDWPTVKKAWKTFDPELHAHPGIGILAYHRTVAPIRGLAVTKDDYCEHMKLQKGQILPDGRKVFVFNDFCRFFDISFVWVGADRTARVMWFLSPANMPKVESIQGRPADPTRLLAEAAAKLMQMKTSGLKTSELTKELSGGYAQAILDRSSTEPSLATKGLETMSSKMGPQTVLSSLAALGIVLKPNEFTAVVKPHVAALQKLANQGFNTDLPGIDDTCAVDPKYCQYGMMKAASGFIPTRSSYAPYLKPRLVPLDRKDEKPVVFEADPIWDKVASMYNGYRISVLEKSAELAVAGTEILDLTPGFAEKRAGSELALLLLGLGPVVHLIASHLEKERGAGRELGAMESFVADNPTFTSISTIGAGLRAAMGIQQAGGILPAASALFRAARTVL